MHLPQTSNETPYAGPRWRFGVLCLFLGSQCVTLPVLAVGPSWAVWPTLQDFAIGLMGLLCILPDRSTPPLSPVCRRLTAWLGLLFAACLLSFLYFTVLFPPAGVEPAEHVLGLFEIVRLGQFLLVFWTTMRISLTPERLRVLHGIVTAALWLVCLGILASFSHVIEPHVFIQHLPQDPSVLGPWQDYNDDELARGWGAVGYNHAYVSTQVLLMLGLMMQLCSRPQPIRTGVAVLLALSASFLCGSRAGFAAVAAFVVLMFLRRPALGLSILLAVLAIGSQISADDLPHELRQVFESQQALSKPTDEDGLNGRTAIWERHWAFLRSNPWLLPCGAGFGYTTATGDAHCLYLQILLEMGFLGLLLWGAVGYRVLASLSVNADGLPAMFWLTLALLFSSITQETFYPVPAFGSLLGLYLCGVALALRRSETLSQQGALTP